MGISISPQEYQQGRLAQDKQDQAVNAIQQEGFVVLDNAVNHQVLDILFDKMCEDSERLIAAQKWGGAGRIAGHLTQGPPPHAPYVFRDIVANPLVIQITQAVLGEGLFNGFYRGNTNTPGSGEQPLHMDGRHLWPAMSVAHPPAQLVINTALIDVTEDRGAIELWPGSHLDLSANGPVSSVAAETRRRFAPPIRGTTKKGSVLIRDVRLWHRGVPNVSDIPRHMIATIHNKAWLKRRFILRYQKGCEAAFDNDELDHCAVFVDQDLDYLFDYEHMVSI